MHTLLSILLYLNVVCSPCAYTTLQINQIETANQLQVDQIENNPAQLQLVETQYGQQADAIIVIDVEQH